MLATPFAPALVLGSPHQRSALARRGIRVDSSRLLEGDVVAVEIGLALGEPGRSSRARACSATRRGCRRRHVVRRHLPPATRATTSPRFAFRGGAGSGLAASAWPPSTGSASSSSSASCLWPIFPRPSAGGAPPRDRAARATPRRTSAPRRRQKGEGIEFADLRLLPARRPCEACELEGDGAPRLARLNEQHPERTR